MTFIFRACLLSSTLLLLTAPVMAEEKGGGASKAAISEENADAPSSLDELVALALAQNPEIEASQARWQAFVAQAKGAGTLEDPMVMLGIQNALIRAPLDFQSDPMTSKVIGVSQMLPFPGKRALQREGAGLEAESARWMVEERKIELRRMVKETWYELYFVDRSVEVVDKNIAILDDLTRFAETMYGVGEGLQQDVLKAQVDRSKMEETRIALRQRRSSLEARFNTLIFRPAETPIPRIPDMELQPLTLTLAELEQVAEENRPLIRSLVARIDKGKVSRKLAEKEFYPDFTVSVEYMQREPIMGEMGDDMYSARLSFNLPVQRQRRHAMVAEASSETRMAEAELNMLRNQIRLGVADSLARMERSSKRSELYREGLLPQSEHALEAAMSAYRVGRAAFMNVLDGQMALFNFEREYYEAVAEHQMQLALLEGVVGKELP